MSDLKQEKETFSGGFAVFFATLGSAVGLGNIWRFPYVAGANGGGAFVLLYILFVVLICVPIMIGEMAMGRRGHGSVVGSVNRLVAAEGAWPVWRVIGWLSLIIPFFGLSY